ncbi:MAG TPA: lactate racemase domain-containing protein [Gaiellaceae bacterium]|nr:lactate racemase domain-containing protein [Gaiellaceae bacterium]
MQRVPLLFGTRLAVVDIPEDGVVLRPPPPGESVADVRAAVRDALRFPLAGEPLETLVTRGGRATLVVEPPALPIPAAPSDPRQDALAAASAELERAGVPTERQTLLVATGLTRRPQRRDLDRLGVVSPAFARRFRGTVAIHDAEDPELAQLDPAGETPLSVHRALVDTDLVLTVSAAETVLDGGPALLLGSGGPQALRAATAYSLLETGASQGWRLAVELERRLSARVPVIGASLVLDQPRIGGAARGYPYDPAASERIVRSPFRRGFGLLPGLVRNRMIHSVRRELRAAAAFAGPPSVAHAEALLRAVEARSAELDRRLDAIVIGIPRTTPHLPRERPNPLLAAYLALGLALRLWREAFPLVEGGTAILLHRFHRHFAHPTQQPYRTIFHALRTGPRDPEELIGAQEAALADERAIAAYRGGRTCHPLLPFADWAGCAPALERLGSVIVAGCRDAVAARQLGFVPARGVPAALEMAHGRAGGRARVGYLLSPPYFPLRVAP